MISKHLPSLRGAATAALLASLMASGAAFAGQLDRLQSLLAATPAGGWVKVNTATFASAWPTGNDAVPTAYGTPAGVVRAWSGFAWDTATSEILFFGGGHANYGGNEMYRWNAATGAWSLGSLPSKFDTTQTNYPIMGGAAPQSAHTYDGNLYLPVNNMFITFGGAAYPQGGNMLNAAGGRTGPWVWDPLKGDGSKVGGGDGTGWDSSRQGGNMWTNRYGSSTGVTQPTEYIHVTAANRVENGKDVVYMTAGGYQTGFPSLYKVTMGDVRAGQTDLWEKVGVMTSNAATGFAYQGVGVIDSSHNLFVRTGSVDPNLWDSIPSTESVFLVWDLAVASSANPAVAKAVKLVKEDGSAFVFSSANMGMDYNTSTGQFFMWAGGSSDGTIYTTQATYGADGTLASTWVVKTFASATGAQPTTDSLSGTLGKFKYVPELDAFIVIEEWNGATSDAAVWLYKPTAVANVPEPAPALMLLGGLAVLGLMRRRLNPS